MVLIQTAAITAPRPPVTKNTQGHPNWYTIQAESGANRKVAKYWLELKTADAVARSAAGNHAATMRPLPGKAGASASPNSSRRASSAANPTVAWNSPAKPRKKGNADHARRLSAWS